MSSKIANWFFECCPGFKLFLLCYHRVSLYNNTVFPFFNYFEFEAEFLWLQLSENISGFVVISAVLPVFVAFCDFVAFLKKITVLIGFLAWRNCPQIFGVILLLFFDLGGVWIQMLLVSFWILPSFGDFFPFSSTKWLMADSRLQKLHFLLWLNVLVCIFGVFATFDSTHSDFRLISLIAPFA